VRITRTALTPAVAVAVALAAGGCGGSGQSEEAAVETVFRSYHAALLARDYVTACSLNAPETSAELVRNVAAQGVGVRTCEEALAAVYGGPGAPVADQVSRTAKVEGVEVSDDTATLTWTFDDQGAARAVDTGLRRIDGQWRLLAVGA
jgi:endonuclease III